MIPASKQVFVPAKVIRKNNVEEFIAGLTRMRLPAGAPC